MSRMAEWAAEHEDDDLEMAAWAHAEELERRQREDAALARCRPLMD